jgi:hypothetical protein
MPLKPGGLGSASAPSTPSAFQNSMAQEIERALSRLLQREGKPGLADDNSPETRDRRVMIAAIAQGVCEHLAKQQSAFVVKGVAGATIEIAVDRSDS